ncbi:MAG: CsgG/HfaB family protein [Treponema sp.]|nr:CsgG/HfaB family protein [Treponema sp.]
MKKLLSALIIAAFALVCSFAESAPKSMAVATFDITGNAVSSDEAESITELYIAELVSTGKVSVVDRTNFNKILKEMQFQAGDWANNEKTVKLGTATGAEIISRGQITKLGSKMYLSATLIDVKTAEVLSSAKVQFVSIDDIFGILTKFAKDAVAGLSLKIGDIGPGGGLICNIEGGHALECSEVLGSATWSRAKEMCSEYRGGGYDDWYLPSREELNFEKVNFRTV